jgi:uncharacterized protein (DUF1684 family)
MDAGLHRGHSDDTVAEKAMYSLAIVVVFAASVLAPQGAYERQVREWRAKHEADYRREYVPLAGLFFLEPGGNTAGSAPGSKVRLPPRAPASIGRFIYGGEQVRFEPDRAATVVLRGERVTSPLVLRPTGEKEPPDELVIGDIALWVHRSGARHAIRMRDTQSTLARSFAGFAWFRIDERYRVTARFRKDPAPRQIRVNSLSGDDQEYTTEGVLEFTLQGTRIRMRPMTTRPGRLYLVFSDATSGRQTYKAARFLYADLEPDGTAVLDFNEAYNPPCAFNPYTTCPLPLPENRLTIPIAAGELDYRGH